MAPNFSKVVTNFLKRSLNNIVARFLNKLRIFPEYSRSLGCNCLVAFLLVTISGVFFG